MSGLRPLVIIGAGGFGREVLDVVRAMNEVEKTFDFLGFLDDGGGDRAVLSRVGAEVLGPVRTLEELDTEFLIGIGSGETRRQIDDLATSLGRTPATAIHPAATLGADVSLGPGTIVTAGARLTTNIRTGRHAQMHVNCTVGHDCVIGDHVTILPGATISGNVRLAQGVMIGTGAAVIQGISIGEGTTVGAGAAVVRDLEAGVTAVGVPAKPLRR